MLKNLHLCHYLPFYSGNFPTKIITLYLECRFGGVSLGIPKGHCG